MTEEKKTGSYYTPEELIRFMIDYLKKEEQDFSNILEPSAGDGRFLPLLLPIARHVDAIEISKEKVKEIQEKHNNEKLETQCVDFLEYAASSQNRYSLIIGNPPYINPKLMKKETIAKAKALCEMKGLPNSIMQNMWLAFIIGSCRLLLPEGTIFFVLPMEFLQVQYAEKLRIHLEEYFNTIHILTFQRRIFPDIEQEICLVYLTNKERCLPHILYNIYEDANIRKPIVTNIIKKNKPLQKWSNAILSDNDISLLREKSLRYNKVNDLGIIAPGIVTGGNKYFILNENEVKELKCRKYVVPILQKSSFVEESRIDINNNVMNQLCKKGRPIFLLNLAKVTTRLPQKLQEYLNRIGNEKIHNIPLKERYKCSNRKPWYGVPIVNKGQVIFFKRYGILPRLYINEADVHTTDVGYRIRLNENIDKECFVFCFYNSLTLAQCEYNGRYYGGGVRELVPSEFKEIVIPYRKIRKEDIIKLKNMFFERKKSEEIVKFVNSRTIVSDMSEEEIEQLENIRLKLIKRRNNRQ